MTGWNPGLIGTAYSLALADTAVYVGGGFTSIGGQARANVAAISPTSGLVTDWNPGADGTVLTLATSGPTVYAGGSFLHIGGRGSSYLAQLLTPQLLAVPPASTTNEPQFTLIRVIPNPTRGPLCIEFELPRESPTRISVTDIMGRDVAKLADASYPAGRHMAIWDGATGLGRAPAGLYFIRLQAGGKSLSQHVVITR